MHFVLREVLAHLPGQMVEAVQSAGVEQRVARFPEDGGHLVVVVGHELRLGGLFGQGKQAMDILHSLEGFLQKGNKKDRKQCLVPVTRAFRSDT